QTELVQVEQAREELALGQVAGRAEKHDHVVLWLRARRRSGRALVGGDAGHAQALARSGRRYVVKVSRRPDDPRPTRQSARAGSATSRTDSRPSPARTSPSQP